MDRDKFLFDPLQTAPWHQLSTLMYRCIVQIQCYCSIGLQITTNIIGTGTLDHCTAHPILFIAVLYGLNHVPWVVEAGGIYMCIMTSSLSTSYFGGVCPGYLSEMCKPHLRYIARIIKFLLTPPNVQKILPYPVQGLVIADYVLTYKQ